tara:strand:+ start:2136 stop:2576 length:441 start_codon:yes stop_codon:yes gene_type:complete
MANRQKQKGDAYERELATYLNEKVYNAKQCSRAPLSGGGFIGFGSGGADLTGTSGLFVEAKRVEKLAWRDALKQAETNAIKTKTEDIPVVITRKSRETTGDSVVFLRLDDFNKLYTAWLTSEGYRTIPFEGDQAMADAFEPADRLR